VAILNGSHDTLSNDHDHETVLVFPDYKVVAEVPRSLDGARELWRNSVNPASHAWARPRKRAPSSPGYPVHMRDLDL